jgi:hypothetical protein
MEIQELAPAQRTELEGVVAAENGDRERRGLAPLSPQAYLDAGFKHSFLDSPVGVAGQRAGRSASVVIDPAAIYAKLNAPQPSPATAASTSKAPTSVPAIDAKLTGEAFAEAVYARANAGHATATADRA